MVKTTMEIKELNCNDYSDCNTPDEYNNKLCDFMNKKWYSEEEVNHIIRCYTEGEFGIEDWNKLKESENDSD